MRRRRRITAPVVVVALGALVLTLTAPTSASSYWQATTTATASLSAASLATPAGLACAPVTLPVANNIARISWTAVPNAASYVVVIRNADGSLSQQLSTPTGTTVDVGVTLLGGLLPGLLAILTGNANLFVTVRAVHSSGWTSAVSTGVPVKRTGVIAGVLGGITCA